ncbi:MAG: DUF2520 domain-containing protein [Salegentibacter sp.]
MKKVVILGAGNVATHLLRAFQASPDIEVIQMYNHKVEHLQPFQEQLATTSDLSRLAKADFYIIALKDDAIKEVVKHMPKTEGIVMHTSGGKSMKVLSKFQHYGVFYPLQTFSKLREINFKEVPLCLEANAPTTLLHMEALARTISENIYEIDSEQRKALHVAAVFANNFTNHLYGIASDICARNGVEFEILRPLIKETAAKVEVLSPPEAQTGPALRRDKQTIKAHLRLLKRDQKKIYKRITSSIKKFHGKKL